jgi:DNA-binding transcriptional regulator YdaS (Cro superfamily)
MIDHSKILERLFAGYGASTLADDLGISRQAVHQWRKVPAIRARDIERITGFPREELRPDIYGEAP